MEFGNEDEDVTAEQLVEQDGMDGTEEGFMQGYSEEEEVIECAECGTAIHEKKITKEIDGESLNFCSVTCVVDYKESISD
jgi:formamidopyrimidine-DNA glycosylase